MGIVLVIAVALAACQPSEAGTDRRIPDTTTTADSPGGLDVEPRRDSVLTADGWGPLRIGMTRAEVVAAVGEDANPAAVGGPEPERCDEFHPLHAPDGMRVMIERNRLTRITLSDGALVETLAGFRVGDAGSAVRATLGERAVTTPHKYWPAPAEYITVWETPPGGSADPRGIVYEVADDGLVVHIHGGGASIQYVEGCL